MFKLETKDSITKQIAGIGRAGVRLAAAIQIAATQVIAHACKHGDVTLANNLLDATPKHGRASLVAFLEGYGPFAYVKADKQVKYFKENVRITSFIGGDLTQEYVDALPKWDSMVKPAEPKSVYDVSAEADRFITRMRKLASDSTLTVKHKPLLDELTATFNRYNAKLVLGDAVDNPVGDAELIQFDKPKAVANS